MDTHITATPSISDLRYPRTSIRHTPRLESMLECQQPVEQIRASRLRSATRLGARSRPTEYALNFEGGRCRGQARLARKPQRRIVPRPARCRLGAAEPANARLDFSLRVRAFQRTRRRSSILVPNVSLEARAQASVDTRRMRPPSIYYLTNPSTVAGNILQRTSAPPVDPLAPGIISGARCRTTDGDVLCDASRFYRRASSTSSAMTGVLK